jgi:hypothetical protein
MTRSINRYLGTWCRRSGIQRTVVRSRSCLSTDVDEEPNRVDCSWLTLYAGADRALSYQ